MQSHLVHAYFGAVATFAEYGEQRADNDEGVHAAAEKEWYTQAQ